MNMSRRPSRSPPRRESDGGAIYRGIHDKPRDLLIFSCNPKTCALPGLDEEVHAVQRAFKRSADVRHVRNLDPKELQKELLSRPPRCFMFVGHANAEVDGAKTLAFCTGKDRELCAVTPETLAKLLGEFSPARGGPLRLVFLNGCQSEALGRAVLDAGVPHVVCWSTIVETKAAAAFSEGFFRAMEEGCDVAGAFEQAKLAVTLIPKHGGASPPRAAGSHLDSTSRPAPHLPLTRFWRRCRAVVSGSMPGFVPKYELRDPRLGVPSLVTTPSGRLAAGIPLHLTSESVAATAATSSTPAAGWLGSGWALAARATTRLKRGVTSLIDGLLDAAEWRAKQTIGSDLRTQTAPQSLEALSLKEGDTIYVEVTIGFWSTVECAPPRCALICDSARPVRPLTHVSDAAARRAHESARLTQSALGCHAVGRPSRLWQAHRGQHPLRPNAPGSAHLR